MALGCPKSVPNVPLPVVDAYHVIPAVTAGIIHEMTTMPPTTTRIHAVARMRSDAKVYPRTTTPIIDPTMKMPVTHSELQNVVSPLRRIRFAVPVKLECTAVGPIKVRLVNPR